MWGWGETNSCMLLEGVRDCRCTESSLEPEEEELEASGAAAEWAGEEAGASPRGVCKAPSFHPQSKALPAEGSQIRGGGVRGPAHGCLGVSTFPSWPAGRMELQFTEWRNARTRFWQGLWLPTRDCISLPPCSVCGHMSKFFPVETGRVMCCFYATKMKLGKKNGIFQVSGNKYFYNYPPELRTKTTSSSIASDSFNELVKKKPMWLDKIHPGWNPWCCEVK